MSDLADIAKKLKERQRAEKSSVTSDAVKMTIYIDKDVADAFSALCVQHGDKRKFATEALSDFVRKKAKELGI